MVTRTSSLLIRLRGKLMSTFTVDHRARLTWVQTTWTSPGLLAGTSSFRVEQGVRALLGSPLARKLPFPEVVLERSRILKRSCKHRFKQVPQPRFLFSMERAPVP